ncbi:hypothetical protein Leryth_009083 [Lithospermum erythrorhizon]|nr:hypothetical protein Leryth_009083 [Lithospermum erythrorhizon]
MVFSCMMNSMLGAICAYSLSVTPISSLNRSPISIYIKICIKYYLLPRFLASLI